MVKKTIYFLAIGKVRFLLLFDWVLLMENFKKIPIFQKFAIRRTNKKFIKRETVRFSGKIE